MAGGGLFIAIEGFEGAGKTTRTKALQTAVRERSDRRCEVVREPGGDPFAEELRELLKASPHQITPWAEVFTFCAARANMLALKVKPLLEAGAVVISDRNYISTVAYQGWGNHWPAAELERLRSVCSVAAQVAPPDLTLVLNVAYETALQRLASRGEASDRFEARGQDYLRAVLDGYIKEARLHNYPIIDGNQLPDKVDVAIWQEVKPHLLT
ncbi:MAG TPA: dTMP kinase [Candidatus Saccharimonadales bacterium]|nr:dTMP kinase [Candidatus Saccharimonadales bacterium]